MTGLLLAVALLLAVGLAVMVTADPADAMAWVCRRYGYVPLTGAEIAALTGLDAELAAITGLGPPPAARAGAPAAPVPGSCPPPGRVPLTEKVIERAPAPGSPPWTGETAP